MRIRQVTVKKLFGTFDHTIPLSLDEHITIILGQNGFGKTVLLNMIHSLFSNSYAIFIRIPFESFRIDFNDDSSLQVKKISHKAQLVIQNIFNNHQEDIVNHPDELVFEYNSPDGRKERYLFTEENSSKQSFPTGIIEDLVPEVTRMSSRLWRLKDTGEVLHLNELLERFSDAFPEHFLESLRGEQPGWLKTLKKQLNIQLIKTDRLLSTPQKPRNPVSKRISKPHAVLTYSTEIAAAINTKLTEYAELSQSLDRTFPQRIFTQKDKRELSLEILKRKLAELEEKRTRLMATGLLDKEEYFDSTIPEDIDGSKKSVLSVYVNDAEHKLSIFKDLAKKIETFTKIINGRFQYKTLSISKDKGFVFKTFDKKELSPRDLSSGEQHEIILLYELLFKVGPGSLILIDEPEISLHVAWQMQFLNDLKEITDLSKIDVLVATHSPEIIDSRWDLTVELKGPEKINA